MNDEKLPIAPWERYMMVDEGPRHSMAAAIRFWYRGNLDRSQTIEALKTVAAINPLVSAQAQGTTWTPVPIHFDDQLDWADSSVPINYGRFPPHDFRCRFTVRHGQANTLGLDQENDDQPGFLLVLHFHHAVMDGHGAIALMRQFWNYIRHEKPSVPTADDLNYRLQVGLSARQCWSRWRWDLPRIWRYFAVLAAPLRNPKPGEQLRSDPNMGIVQKRLTKEQTQVVLATAQQWQVTVNTLIMAAYFRCLGKQMGPTKRVRLGLALSMRPEGNQAVCNLVSMVFLDRKPSTYTPSQLIKSLHDEMNLIKTRQSGHAMLSCLRLIARGRGLGLKLALRAPIVSCSSVFTNLGRAVLNGREVASDTCQFLAMDTVPPLRPRTNAALSLNTFDGRINWTISHQPSQISSSAIQDILNDLFQTIEEMGRISP